MVDYLANAGYNCLAADNGLDAILLFKNNTIDLAILDIMVPQLDGFSLCKQIRQTSNIPVIFLTAKQAESDKLKGYETGADDYVTKPFSPNVLVAKVRALLKRSGNPDSFNTICAGQICLKPLSQEVCIADEIIELTHKEYQLLLLFMQHPRQVFSREHLLNTLWGFDFAGTTRTVDSHIKTLRQKLKSEGRYIVTLIRSGYLPKPFGGYTFFSLMILLVVGINAVLHRLITQPLQQLNDISKRMAALDFSACSNINSQDEYGELSDTLNILASNLNHALKQRKELTDTLSHEMKTPLGIIRAYAEGLHDEPNTKKQLEYAAVIIAEAGKMADMVNTLLDLSALEAGASPLSIESFDLVELVETVAGRFFVDAPQGDFDFTYDLPETSIQINADQIRIEQVIQNFMDNARKYVKPKGTIHLTLSLEKDTICFSLYNDCDFLDSINTEYLWTNFYRGEVRKNKDSSGLGLVC